MKRFFLRILTLLAGLFSFALGVVITIKANIGYAPWDVFHVGLANTTGLSIGIVSIITGITIVVIVTILGEKPGFGTIMNMFVIGLFIDILFPHITIAQNLIIGFLMLIFGLFIISIGSYFYIKAAFGTGPRDSLMVALARRTKLPVGLCRCIIELMATIIGWVLGGLVGIGTVISVIAIGFCVQITFKILKFDVTAVKHETLRDTYVMLKSSMRS